MDEKKTAASFPHVKGTLSTVGIMQTVVLALLPAIGLGVWNHGRHVLLQVIVCVVACWLSEFAFEAFLDRPLAAGDWSAAVTGCMLALLLPASAPLWMGALGGCFGIIVIKMLFGGIGRNRLNPALSGYCLLLILFGDRLKEETLLTELLAGGSPDPWPLFTGQTNGSVGAACALAVLIGAVLLLAVGVIRLQIPLAGIISFTLVLLLFGGHGADEVYLVTQLCGGGFLFGIFFMATDYSTSPLTRRGQVLYGLLIGILAAALRIGGIEEAIVYAILIANLATPLLDRMTVPRFLGQRRLVRVNAQKKQEEV